MIAPAASVFSAIVRDRIGGAIASSEACRSVAEAAAWLNGWIATADDAPRAARGEIIGAPLARPERVRVERLYAVDHGAWVEVAYLPARRREVGRAHVRVPHDSIRRGLL